MTTLGHLQLLAFAMCIIGSTSEQAIIAWPGAVLLCATWAYSIGHRRHWF